jgi:hypothetical protein
MFNAESIQSRLRQQPFRPLRIVTTSGEAIAVTHPDLVLVGSRDIIIGTANRRNPSIYDTVTRIALIHITALEDIPQAVPPGTDGQ